MCAGQNKSNWACWVAFFCRQTTYFFLINNDIKDTQIKKVFSVVLYLLQQTRAT